MLGIGIVSLNRLPKLQRCVERLQAFTSVPFMLAVADDGSTDGALEWARNAGLKVVAGPNRGTAWNMNRALYYLGEVADCDPIITMESDACPLEAGWEQLWIAGARKWQHVSYSYRPAADLPPDSGSGTAEDPFKLGDFGAQCTCTTRAALEAVGYADVRFGGYGYANAEWAWRMAHRFYPQIEPGKPDGLYLVKCLQGAVGASWDETFDTDPAHMEASVALAYQLIADLRAGREPVYRNPWRTLEQREAFLGEIEAARGS